MHGARHAERALVGDSDAARGRRARVSGMVPQVIMTVVKLELE